MMTEKVAKLLRSHRSRAVMRGRLYDQCRQIECTQSRKSCRSRNIRCALMTNRPESLRALVTWAAIRDTFWLVDEPNGGQLSSHAHGLPASVTLETESLVGLRGTRWQLSVASSRNFKQCCCLRRFFGGRVSERFGHIARLDLACRRIGSAGCVTDATSACRTSCGVGHRIRIAC